MDMIRDTRKPFTLLALFSSLLLASACGGGDAQNSSDSPVTAYADGWDELLVDANRGTTKVYSHGHFHVSWNPCFKEAWGAVKDPKSWDSIVRATNAAIKATMLSEERCFEAGEGNRMDSRVAVKLVDKREIVLMEANGASRICTKVADQALIQELLKGVNGVIRESEREDCYRD